MSPELCEHAKIFPCAALPSLSRIRLEKRWLEGKFWVRAKFALSKNWPILTLLKKFALNMSQKSRWRTAPSAVVNC